MNEIDEQIKSQAIVDENHPQPELITNLNFIKGYYISKNMSQIFKIYLYLIIRDLMKSSTI